MAREVQNFAEKTDLFSSELYSICSFNSHYDNRHHFNPSYTAAFCINFTHKGYFTFNSFHQSHEEHTSRILIEKPGCEFNLTQEAAGEGACTIIRFTDAAYEMIRDKFKIKESSFFNNINLFSLLLTANAEAEYLHHRILKTLAAKNSSALELDTLVMELLNNVMKTITGSSVRLELSESSKKNHLSTVERAKEYMLDNFTKDISLHELARHCYVSPFHFSRLFKQFSTYSPYQFLQHIRLKHAETLLRTTELPITDVCFRSGFSRLDYFSAAFSKKYTISPSRYKICFS